MTKIPQVPQGKSGARCKARAGKQAAYSRPWVAALVKDAIDSADLGGAARRAGVGLQEVSRARAEDPAIDAALAEVDQSLRLAATAAVIAQAAAGNLRAIKALTDGTLARLDQSFGAAPDSPPPHVAAAMIAAGLKALKGPDKPPPVPPLQVQCPHCSLWMGLSLPDDPGSNLLGLQITTGPAALPVPPTPRSR